jgi:hypothetical protein
LPNSSADVFKAMLNTADIYDKINVIIANQSMMIFYIQNNSTLTPDCFAYCNKQGHLARECPLKKNNANIEIFRNCHLQHPLANKNRIHFLNGHGG